MSNYLLGYATGMVLGIVIGLPMGNEMVVKLDKEDARALKSGAEISEALKQRTCSAIEKALTDFRDNKTDVIKICPDDLRSDKPN